MPPAAGPKTGVIEATTGAKEYRSCGPVALVPPAEVTVTSTTPVPGGDAATTLHTPLGVSIAAVERGSGHRAEVRAGGLAQVVTVIRTLVPPAPGPKAGVIEATTGA